MSTLYMFDQPRTVNHSLTVLPLTIAQRFDAFHDANPHVFTRLRELAFDWKGAGHDRCSMDMLFHLLRWEHGIKTTGDTFKLNNDFTAHYARKLMAHEAGLEGFFETRESI